MLPDPSTSRAVLIGASSYDHFEDIPAIENNINGLRDFLTSQDGWSLPAEHCLMVPHPRTSADIIHAVQQAAVEATDTLFLYYAGHGVLDDELRFYLTLEGSSDKEPWTCVAYEWVGKSLSRSNARRRIAIVDSCFSGKIHKKGVMSDASNVVKSQTAATGTVVLTSARDDRVALAPPGEDYTAFTGELLKVLNEGIPGDPPHISIHRAYESVKEALKAKGRPRPDCTGNDTAGRIVIARNRSLLGADRDSADSIHLPSPRIPHRETLSALVRRIGLQPVAVGRPSREIPRLIAARYEVLGLLGMGGMGRVVRAVDTRLGRPVAVKFLERWNQDHYETVSRDTRLGPVGEVVNAILNEAKAVAALNHAGIAAVFDVVDRARETCIVMEYIEGDNLDRVVRNHKLSGSECVAIVHEVLDALIHAHEAGVIHCDVKPANVMLTIKGQVKILDFGIAHLVGDQGGSVHGRIPGNFVGTIAYMPPEAFQNELPNFARDLYGVGVTFRHLLTGTDSRDGAPLEEMVRERIHGEVKLPSEITPEVGTKYDSYLAKALARDPARRFQSAIEMKEALADLTSGA